MSFILDALKKSEAERQNKAGAGISNTPQARTHDQLPAWAIGLIGVLGLAVIGLGWAWWQAQRMPAPVGARVTDPPPLAAPAGGPVRDLAAEARPADHRPPVPAAATRTTAAAAATMPVDARPADPQPAAAKTAAATQAQASATLPTAADLAVQGIALPDMNLDIHVYSNNRSERFVFINSAKYREGDRLPDGPRVEQITADGVVLNHQGVSFMLPRD